jgi:hypothetical protein
VLAHGVANRHPVENGEERRNGQHQERPRSNPRTPPARRWSSSGSQPTGSHGNTWVLFARRGSVKSTPDP